MHRAKKRSPLDYAFAVGKIRALEKFLIREEAFREAIEADLGEALRLFVESDLYSGELMHIENSQQLEGVLANELLKLKKLVRELILDAELKSALDFDTIACIGHIRKAYPSEFLNDYLAYVIDMHNIKSFLRLYILGEPEEKLRGAITCEGFIRRGDFLKLYSAGLAVFINRLEFVHKHDQVIDYAFYLKSAIYEAEQKKSFVALEKAINDFLIEALRPAKYLHFGPEPVLAYYFAKVNEINLVRMIILAKLNNLPDGLVKERLNSVYA